MVYTTRVPAPNFVDEGVGLYWTINTWDEDIDIVSEKVNDVRVEVKIYADAERADIDGDFGGYRFLYFTAGDTVTSEISYGLNRRSHPPDEDSETVISGKEKMNREEFEDLTSEILIDHFDVKPETDLAEVIEA